ncbi:hypothetical protein OIU84_020550 [Salix udensis]|uniref:Uncharacterized protein n=1 Tax=Salix udensis TaxID=889485 RepID=A0AAD6KSZ3_9ROSI|nr:hypothetical protein OIU84_020550 [Salix udensis]
MFLMLKELLSHFNKNRSIMTVVVQKLFACSDFQKNWVFRGRIPMKIYFLGPFPDKNTEDITQEHKLYTRDAQERIRKCSMKEYGQRGWPGNPDRVIDIHLTSAFTKTSSWY